MSKEITSKTIRLAQILSLLEKGPVTVPDLATRFGVSVRTIQRDMGLFWQANAPVISTKQSVYAFAPGFSLAAAHLSCEQVALLVVSADIAHQIGGEFAAVQPHISKRFEPTSFEHCDFEASAADFEETDQLAHNLLQCTQTHCTIRVFLKDIKKDRTFQPYKLVCIWGKWYVACVAYGREIVRVALDNIGNFSLRDSFDPIPFAQWAIWQRAHQWVEELNPAKEQAPQPPQAVQTEPIHPQTLLTETEMKQENDN